MGRRKGETSYKETAFGIIPRSQLIPLEIEGIRRSWIFVLKTVSTRTRITPTLLKKIHQVGFAWIFPDVGGRFRKVDVEVSDHKPPAFFSVPELIENFCLDLAERLKHLPSITRQDFLQELVSLLAWAHHRFLWIHPFQDYNGRLARLLTNVILLKLELPPIEMHVETTRGRKNYIDALERADHGDARQLEKIVLCAIQEAARELRNQSRVVS